MTHLVIRCLFYRVLMSVATSSSSTNLIDRLGLYQIEGKIVFLAGDNDLDNIRILVDEGQYVGIPRADGTFLISGVPSGSYIVSVNSPFHVFEPARVEITTKGKTRARKVDFIQPGKVVMIKYPLHFEAHGQPSYFQQRETYRLIDIILNPTFLSIIVPVALFIFLPRIALQEQDTQEIFQQTNDVLQRNWNYPDISDWLARRFGGPTRQRPVN